MKQYILILFFSILSIGLNASGGPGDRDTLRASVEYGNETLFPVGFFSKYDLNSIYSVCQNELPNNINKEEVALYLRTIALGKKECESVIDSISKNTNPNYRLINALSNYLRNRPRYRIKDESIVDQKNTAFPAHSIYGTWNPHVAFEQNLNIEDNIELTLVNSETNCDYHHPLSEKTMRRYHGIVTSKYGWRKGKNHNGVDLELHQWDSVHNMFPGVVRFSKRYAGFGKVVIVRHYNGLETLYAHLSKISVKSGDIVEAGDLVGLGGQTGNASGTHLHMEIRYKNVPVNPEHIISFEKRDLTNNKFILKKSRHGYIAIPEGIESHVVRKGDYISKVAKRYGMSIEELCNLNNISRKKRLKVGDTLLVNY